MATRMRVRADRAADPATSPRGRRHRRRFAALEVTEEQRAWLTAHGFGPDAPRRDFTDPAVRAELVQSLRDCGVLPAEPTAAPATPAVRRVG